MTQIDSAPSLDTIATGDVVEFQIGPGAHTRLGIVREVYRYPDGKINYLQVDHYMQNLPFAYVKSIKKKFATRESEGQV